MSWKKLLQDNKVHRHATSRKELAELRRLIVRDLADASLAGLSEDRRFATAYNAALQTAKMAISCAGYRIASVPENAMRLTIPAPRSPQRPKPTS